MVVTSRRRNDRSAPARGAHRHSRQAPGAATGHWLWGWHAVTAALSNPAREAPRRILVTAERVRALDGPIASGIQMEIIENAAISARLPAGAAHQGVALDVAPLAPTPLAELATPPTGVILMLDQVTDPQNVGAIFRSAAAFGARGVVLQERHAPLLAGTLAKAAAGAIDKIPHAREINLSRALERLDELGWRAVGLDGTAPDHLADVLDARATVLVIGSEGEGLRRLVREHCDAMAAIPMAGGFDSLNVAAAAAVALYEASRALARR
ncbi:MAG: 23S rRNA (guanosine(2251)-2'-O)-methyltransferase RlmB [Caulobacteraceae bacterium]